jgi:thioredoxin-dependent peroxiredoxin
MTDQMTGVPQKGAPAPAFSLKAHTGATVSLADLRGKKVILYFYPKDNTPGCTLEATEFQAHLQEFEKAGAVVVGVSPDTTASHCRFADKHGLSLLLLSDEDHAVASKYGVWVEKNRYGKKGWGIQRSTFLIDGEGLVLETWPKVRVEGHAEQVFDALSKA